jgi:hypothetical protein
VEPEDDDDDKYSILAREWQEKLLASEGLPSDRRRVYEAHLKDDQDEIARFLASAENNPRRFGMLKRRIAFYRELLAEDDDYEGPSA